MSDIAYLPDGSVVIVVGDAPPRATSTDGGATTQEVPQKLVARLAVEEVEADAVHSEPPAPAEEEAAPGEPEPISKAAPLTGDQIDAEIAKLQAQKAAVESGQSAI